MILDTNAVSAILAGEESIRSILTSSRTLLVPSIVVGEYRYGLTASTKQATLTEAFERLLRTLTLAPIDEPVTGHYAAVRRLLREAGTPIPENDVWIAALARRHEMPILSRDSHFDLVPGIKRVGW